MLKIFDPLSKHCMITNRIGILYHLYFPDRITLFLEAHSIQAIIGRQRASDAPPRPRTLFICHRQRRASHPHNKSRQIDFPHGVYFVNIFPFCGKKEAVSQSPTSVTIFANGLFPRQGCLYTPCSSRLYTRAPVV